jgi:hypothetical protein
MYPAETSDHHIVIRDTSTQISKLGIGSLCESVLEHGVLSRAIVYDIASSR